MRRVSLRQRRRTLGGQHVDAARLIHTRLASGLYQAPSPSATTPGIMRGVTFASICTSPRSLKMRTRIAVVNAALAGIHRVDPHLLPTGGLQHIDVAVGRVDARFIVEAGQLQREFRCQRIVVVFETWGVDRQRIDNIPFRQLPGGRDFRQFLRSKFRSCPTAWSADWPADPHGRLCRPRDALADRAAYRCPA